MVGMLAHLEEAEKRHCVGWRHMYMLEMVCWLIVLVLIFTFIIYNIN